jgi:hypothetical protein
VVIADWNNMKYGGMIEKSVQHFLNSIQHAALLD